MILCWQDWLRQFDFLQHMRRDEIKSDLKMDNECGHAEFISVSVIELKRS